MKNLFSCLLLFVFTIGVNAQGGNAIFGITPATGSYPTPGLYENFNSVFGYQAMKGIDGVSPTTTPAAQANCAFGYQSLMNNQLSSGNSAFGTSSLASVSTNTGTGGNSAFGNSAMSNLTSGQLNSAFGLETLRMATGNNNIAMGYRALGGDTFARTASGNIAIGIAAFQNGVGDNNIAIGAGAMWAGNNGTASVGSANIVIGNASAINFNSTSVTNNVFLGNETGTSLTTGAQNVLVGYQAGKSITTGSNNVIIGRYHMPSAGDGTDFGNNSNNSIILADGSSNIARLTVANNGNVGIGLGNTKAQNRLEIKSATANTSGLLFSNLKSTFSPTSTASKFLTVDSAGNVILQNLPAASSGYTTIAAGTNISLSGSASSGYTIAATPSLSVTGTTLSISGGNTVSLPGFTDTDTSIYNSDGNINSGRLVNLNANLLFNTTSGGKIYIGDKTTVAGATYTGNYKLFVEEGIMAEKVKVAIEGTGNWMDHVFETNYKLMPLTDLEKFVKSEKHLPGINSAEDLVKNGLDIGEMQAKQMGKIEELVLYTIEQNKMIQAQQHQIDELEKKLAELLKVSQSEKK
ncbi:autotransporter outer membrane beta-barrel domain-containing protein [Flavobacterium silvaticum]|uniref:TMF family protein n=1 Tax=Flavobacterium silvaticum TaxID=1852020 RepID=A0A972JIY6_9FLAO|nr:hypothetical protein [Flavobacterium silvaticum]NMH29550.1 hypothetical protein [Flavobacterium silvaticum]